MAACVVCQAAATVYCQNDKAFLCNACDVTIHSSNLVAGRHTRVSVCECCNKAAAAVFCKNDRAFLCEACDVEVHAGNPLAASHEIVSVDKLCEEQSVVQKQNSDMCESHSATTPCCSTVPSATAVRSSTTGSMPPAARACASPACSEAVVPVLMPADSQQPQMMLPSSKDSLYKGTWGKDFDGLELDNAWLDRLDVGFDFSDILAQDAHDADDHGLVPNLGPRAASLVPSMEQEAAAVPVMQAMDARSDSYDDCTVPRLAMHNLEHAFSLDDDFMPSFKVPFSGPPDASYLVQTPMATVNNNNMILQTSLPFNAQPQPIMHVTSQQAALNREQRVLRYREKRKNRKFEKTIRYASRKAYAEVRPRIKGRFAKKEEIAAWEAAGDAMVPEVSGGMMKVEMVSMQ